MLLKPLDIGIVVCALGAVIFSFFFVYGGSGGRGMIHIKAESGEWVFPMDAAQTMSIAGPLGETIITIGGNSAGITASPCLNQVCVAAGLVRLPGQWSACLPNRVMLYIEQADNKSDVDATAW